MTNPLVHALVFLAAVLIPGGLLVYFAWRATRKSISPKGEPNQTRQKQGSEDISDRPPTPIEAQSAFRAMFPKDSLRARSRERQLKAYKNRHRKKSH
jgi:hypothetical protein